MSGEMAIGDAVTGALVARAVEPHGAQHGGGEHGLCLNCGTALIGEHCHRCGQSGHVHRTVGAIGHEIAHGVFHFEGRIWRTLPMLVLRPGELTRRYIAGERARFVSPLALFLFTVFLMFAVYGIVGPGDLSQGITRAVSQTQSGIEQGQEKTRLAIALDRLEKERKALVRGGGEPARIDAEIARTRAALTTITPPDAASDTSEVKTNWPWLDHGIERLRANPGLVAYKVQSSAYKFSWALILLSTPFVALLFLWRRRFNLYDHAIFVTYSIAFMSLLAIVLEIGLTLSLPSALFWWLLLLAPPAHMFAQLRGAYRLSVFSALWRTVMLLAFSVTVLLLFVLGLLAMGISH